METILVKHARERVEENLCEKEQGTPLKDCHEKPEIQRKAFW